MKIISHDYELVHLTWTTYEWNDWTNSKDRNDWNMKIKLVRYYYLLGFPIWCVDLMSETVPEYAQCALGTLGYSDWFDKSPVMM